MDDLVLNDETIRKALVGGLTGKQARNRNRLVINELGLEKGKVRADIAVVDDQALWLYEIKGETDTFVRLPGQVESYSKVADYAIAVVAASHSKKVKALIPDWWGILEASRVVVDPTAGVTVGLKVLRNPQKNPGRDSYAMAQLMWRDEAYYALRKAGRGRGMSSSPRAVLWAALASALTQDELAAMVRDILRRREGWLTDSRAIAVDKPERSEKASQ